MGVLIAFRSETSCKLWTLLTLPFNDPWFAYPPGIGPFPCVTHVQGLGPRGIARSVCSVCLPTQWLHAAVWLLTPLSGLVVHWRLFASVFSPLRRLFAP